MKPKEICSLMKCEYLNDFVEEAYAIKFKEQPNYNKLRFLLAKNLLDKELVPTNKLNWIGRVGVIPQEILLAISNESIEISNQSLS